MEDAATSLVSTIAQLAADEFRQLSGVGGEVALLRNELSTINALLRMQLEADESAVSHFVREWMKQLREVGYDAQDCVDLYLLHVRSRQGDSFLGRWRRILKTLCSRRCLAGEIRDLRTQASSINEHHSRYGVSLEAQLGRRGGAARRLPPAVVAASAGALCQGDDPSQTSVFVGNKEVVKELADKVKNPEDKQLRVFSIWGFGGLGKTTLAVELCRQLEAEFPRQAKVSVSQTFTGKQDLQGLLRRLLRQIAQPKQTAPTVGAQPPNSTSDVGPQAAGNNSETTDGGGGNTAADPPVNIETMNLVELQNKIEESVRSNRYLILIDDVWSITAWDVIRSQLPNNKCGSRIIVTTRIDTVAKACSDAKDDYIHRMEKLDERESKELFVRKAFGSAGNPCPKDKNLNDTMTSILEKCGGLPLAIVSIASLLASYRLPQGKEMWRLVQRSIGSQMEINPTLEGMREILTLSYNHLPHHLKACMMYLSIFPEDYMACKDRLLRRWIAEGLVAEKRGLTQMEVAEGYFSELMSRSMIDKVTDIVTSYERREEIRCRVHDMMLEIVTSKSLEANFVSLVGGQYEGMSYTNTIRRLSIHGGVEVVAHKDTSSNNKKNVAAHEDTCNNSSKKTTKKKKKNVAADHNNTIVEETMMVQHVRSLSIFDSRPHKELLNRLGEFTLLRVLDLEDCKGLEDKHILHICGMYILRFLSLKGTDITSMPPRLGDLKHLQTLDVRQTYLLDLPDTIVKLEKLEHLLFSNKGTFIGWTLPRGISKMKALRQVHRAVIHESTVAEEFGELDRLQELAIYVDTGKHEMDHLKTVVEQLGCSLSKMYSLRWLDVGNVGYMKWPFKPILNFLNEVKPAPTLQYLRICGCFRSLPCWMGSLTDLVEVDISWTYIHSGQLFEILCKLPNLNRLSLGAYVIWKGQDMVFSQFARNTRQRVEEEEEEGQGVKKTMAVAFPELKELNLGYSPETPEVYRFEQGSVPKLEMLVVTFGDQWKQIVGLKHLTKLNEVQFAGYREQMNHAVEQLVEMNKERVTTGKQQITIRLTYSDGTSNKT